MQISLIAAMTDDGIIGARNRMPWHLPSDMKWFREHTLGKPIVMGRKTYESFGAKPLPQRHNIVVTRDRDYQAEGISVVHDIDAALQAADGAQEVMIIGGASFYAQMLPRAQRLYITYVHTLIEGDAWFPHFNPDRWQQARRRECPADEKNPFAHTFVVLDRKPVQPV